MTQAAGSKDQILGGCCIHDPHQAYKFCRALLRFVRNVVCQHTHRQSWKASSQLQVKDVVWKSYMISVVQWQSADIQWLVHADPCTSNL